MARQLDQPHLETIPWFNLGLVRLRQGALDEARASFILSLQRQDAGSGMLVAFQLVGAAAVAARMGAASHAARLLGCSDAILEEIQVSLEPYEASVRAQALAEIEEALGSDVAREALASGRELSPAEGVELALGQRPDAST